MGSPNEAATQPGPGSGPPAGPGAPGTHHDGGDGGGDPLTTLVANHNEDNNVRSSNNSSPSSTTGSTGSSSSTTSSSATAPETRANGKHGGRRWKAEHQPLRKPSIEAEEEEMKTTTTLPIETTCSALPRPEVVVTPSRVIVTSEESDDDERKLTPSPPLLPSGQKPEQQQDHYCLRWTNHGSHVLGVFAQLLRDESLVDVTLAAEGRSLRAHKMVLSACSSFFRTLFVSHSEQRHPIVILKDTKFTELESLLQFMYKGEVSVEYGQLATLLKTAENLRVKGLADVTTTATPKAKMEEEEEEEEEEEDDDEEEEEEEEDDEDEDMFVDQEDANNPIVIERNALTSGLSVGKIQRRQRRRHHVNNVSNPYRRSLLHPNLQLNPTQLKSSGRPAGLDNHHRLVQQQQKQQGSSGHYRTIDESVVPLDLIHTEAIQDLSSNTAAGLSDRRSQHNSRRNNPPNHHHHHLHHQMTGEWKPPNELQHPPRRQLKPTSSSNHQQQHNHQKPQEAHRNDPASGDRNTSTVENRSNCDRDPDDGDHNHRFKSGSAEGTCILDSMMPVAAQDSSATAQDLRSRRHSLSHVQSPTSPLPSGPPVATTATSNATTSAGTAHQRFRHWMMDEESDESGEDDMEETKTEETTTYLRNRRHGRNTSDAHPPSGSPQHLPMVI